MLSGFTFILSNIEIENFSPIELIDNHTLRKANDTEVSLIKDELKKIDIYYGLFKEDRQFIYEIEVNDEKTEQGITHHKIQLAKNKWRYWVISFNGSNNKLTNLEEAISLLKNSFEFGFLFVSFNEKNSGIIQSRQWMNSYIEMEEKYFENTSQTISFQEIRTISNIYNKLQLQRDTYPYISHAIKNFTELKTMKSNLDLLLVGYFSIIETLITHPPRLNENLDSISHQITNKLSLLIKMFIRKILYTKYFEDVKEETVWKKLYGY